MEVPLVAEREVIAIDPKWAITSDGHLKINCPGRLAPVMECRITGIYVIMSMKLWTIWDKLPTLLQPNSIYQVVSRLG